MLPSILADICISFTNLINLEKSEEKNIPWYLILSTYYGDKETDVIIRAGLQITVMYTQI